MKLITLLILSLLSFNAYAVTGYGEFTYVAPTERIDNSPLPLSEAVLLAGS